MQAHMSQGPLGPSARWPIDPPKLQWPNLPPNHPPLAHSWDLLNQLRSIVLTFSLEQLSVLSVLVPFARLSSVPEVPKPHEHVKGATLLGYRSLSSGSYSSAGAPLHASSLRGQLAAQYA
jgi:hypothetical protein